MRQIELGDTVVTDDGGKGFTVRAKMTNTTLVWYNQHAEIELLKWLTEKYGRTLKPDIISVAQARKEFKTDNPPHMGEKETK